MILTKPAVLDKSRLLFLIGVYFILLWYYLGFAIYQYLEMQCVSKLKTVSLFFLQSFESQMKPVESETNPSVSPVTVSKLLTLQPYKSRKISKETSKETFKCSLR